MMFPSITFSLSVISIHKHSLNFNLPDHHLILYPLLCQINMEHSIKVGDKSLITF